ncbi:MAG: hypothetical protein IJF49_08515 [Clostridia bacterium]|nr:hypothetical protein [Clostridia bacterium]
MEHRFIVDGETYGTEILRSGVDYEIDVNGSGDLRFGVVACGVMKFSVIAPHPFTDGGAFVWQRRQLEEDEFAVMGQFTVRSITRRGSVYDIEARDGMAALDVDAKQYLDAMLYPTTLFSLAANLCVIFGIVFESSMVNSGVMVTASPYWDGATVRDIFSMIAEVSGAFAMFRSSGVFYLGGYRETGVALTKEHYSSPFVADYEVAAIDKVQIRATQGDIGVIAGSGTNTYVIEGNPIFALADSADVVDCAGNLLARASAITYTPCEVPLFNDRGLRVGDIFTIDGVRSIVMSYRCTARGTVISCTGAPRRETQSTASNRDVIALLGKTNELTRTSALLESRLTDAEGNISVIEQASGEISAFVNAQGIRITTLETEMTGTVKFTNLTDGVTSISGSNIDTGTISAIEITGCKVSSVGVFTSSAGVGISGVMLDGGILTFSGELLSNGYSYTSTISAVNGLELSSDGPFTARATEGLTLSGGVILLEGAGIFCNRGGTLYVNVDSGNIGQYISLYLGA